MAKRKTSKKVQGRVRGYREQSTPRHKAQIKPGRGRKSSPRPGPKPSSR